jgi:rhodanese-related sulfurtransferase
MRGLSVLSLCAAFFVLGCATHKPYDDPDGLAWLVAQKSGPYFLVDVRTPAEYASGHIPSAVNIPVTELQDRLPTTDRSALIIVYCASGGRSASAAKLLGGLGFTRVVNFGAVSRWGGGLVRGDKPE